MVNTHASQVLRPSFFVVGAQKAGTTALHHYLAADARIFLPAIKETHFFNDGHGEYGAGLDHYLTTYFRVPEQRILAGEVDPEYLYFPLTAQRLAEHFPSAKLVFVFREPVARAFSHYAMSYRRGIETLTFADAIEAEQQRLRGSVQEQSDFSYVSRGYYLRQVENYLRYFPKERMLFLLSEDLIRARQDSLDAVYDFLELPPIPVAELDSNARNEGGLPINMGVQRLMAKPSRLKDFGKAVLPKQFRLGIRRFLEEKNRRTGRFPPMPDNVRRELKALYQRENDALGAFIQRDLSKWNQ